jgi:hypothetical protein
MRNLFPCFALLRTLIERSDHYVMEHAARFRVDESHNHIHSRHVLHYTKEILVRQDNVKPYDILLASLGAVLHDVSDPKYIPDTAPALRHAVESVLPWNLHSSVGADLQRMLPHLSFSKTVCREGYRLRYTLPDAMQTFPHLDSYHAVRQADLLSSYNTKRTLLYRMHKSNLTKSREDVLDEARELYRRRMALLRPSGMFLHHDIDDALARPLETEATRRWRTAPTVFPTWETMVDHFDMDPNEPFEKTVDDLEQLLETR